jgi:hypothetical protein
MAHKYGSKIYHNSFSSAVQMAQSDAEANGYEVDEQSWFNTVAMGQGRPKQGETTRFSVELLKDGKPSKKQLHVQVYGMEHAYELNHYIN